MARTTAICATIARMRLPLIVGVMLALTLTATAQTPFKLDAGDAAYWAGSAVDTATSVGKQEAGLFRRSDGTYAVGPNLLFKSALWGGLKVLEWKQPQHRRAWMWTKVAIGVAFGAVGAFHNSRINRR